MKRPPTIPRKSENPKFLKSNFKLSNHNTRETLQFGLIVLQFQLYLNCERVMERSRRTKVSKFDLSELQDAREKGVSRLDQLEVPK